jgi:hypothetical protein
MTLLRKIIITLTAVGIVTGSPSALVFAETNQTRVTVTMMRESCDYFIVETDEGFCIFEWFGGSMPIEGDVLRGELDSYGFQNAYNVTQEVEIKAFVEEYWLGREEAVEKLYAMCGLDHGGSSVD